MSEPAIDPRSEALCDLVLLEQLSGGELQFSSEAARFDHRTLAELVELRDTASAVTAAMVARPVPAHLAERLRFDAARVLFEQRSLGRGNSAGAPPGRTMRLALWSAACGAAATILLGLALRSAPLPPEQRRSELLAAADLQRIEWHRGPSPLSGAVRGDVVWSDSRQQGFMQFEGLPPLDPTRQYQLWIFDSERSAEQPVDGGVFDVLPDRTTIVPIDAKLGVRHAAAFAVTVELRGGVVVSKREHIVATAGL